MQSEATGPLRGLRVLELGVLVAGPFCGQLLGDLGAEVIKIEPPGQADPLREWGSVRPHGRSLWFSVVGRNKKAITLDLRLPEGQAVFRDLVAQSDIVVENFRPGVMERWGLGFEALRDANPRIIMVRVSGYGQTGPMASKAGYASVGEAMGGLRYVMGEPDRKPSRAGISLGDSVTGLFAAFGAVAALQERSRSGRGQVVDVAIYESVLALMESLIPDYQFGGFIRERTGAQLPNVAPSNIYACLDGDVLIAANQDSVFKRLCEAMGADDLKADGRFSTNAGRVAAREYLDQRIETWCRAHSVETIMNVCDAHGVACGVLNRAPELLADPHVAARKAIVEVIDSVLGPIKMQAPAPIFSETPGNVRSAAPEPGVDTDAVLSSLLSYGAARINALKASGAIG